MKFTPLQISCVINLSLGLIWASVQVYKTGHSVPHAWVSEQRAEFNPIKMRLDCNGQGLLFQAGSRRQHDKTIKSLDVYDVVWTDKGNAIHIYQTDKSYLNRGQLLGTASITGYRRLEVVFSKSLSKNFPARANFKSIT